MRIDDSPPFSFGRQASGQLSRHLLEHTGYTSIHIRHGFQMVTALVPRPSGLAQPAQRRFMASGLSVGESSGVSKHPRARMRGNAGKTLAGGDTESELFER